MVNILLWPVRADNEKLRRNFGKVEAVLLGWLVSIWLVWVMPSSDWLSVCERRETDNYAMICEGLFAFSICRQSSIPFTRCTSVTEIGTNVRSRASVSQQTVTHIDCSHQFGKYANLCSIWTEAIGFRDQRNISDYHSFSKGATKSFNTQPMDLWSHIVTGQSTSWVQEMTHQCRLTHARTK